MWKYDGHTTQYNSSFTFRFSSRLICLFSAVFFGFEKKVRDKKVVAARNIALDKVNPTKELLKIYSVRDQFLSEKTQTPTIKHK